MELTLEHFLQLIDEIPKGVQYDYVRPGTNKIILEGVNYEDQIIEASKFDVSTSSTKSANISTDNIHLFVTHVKENKPLHIESVWNGSGSSRSAWEGLFAHCSEFYTYISKGKKHLVWVPTKPHTVGEICHLTKDDLLVLTESDKKNATDINLKYRPYITAIKSKPFLLLAGISGTGKSRIVRELARACWEYNSEEYKLQTPPNFKMVQVKPNWHDSTELIGYVSRVSGNPIFIPGEFLKFVVKAWEHTDIPYFLCLDEMNLAPVEQYFAEYLSVIESRKNKLEDDVESVVTDPIINAELEYSESGELKPKGWYESLIKELLVGCPVEKLFALTQQFLNDGISIPQNLIVVGTVNMDETTFSFSRKVLDRAMTIEMNEVDLHSGLTDEHEQIGLLSADDLIGMAVEGKDVYLDNQEVCEVVISYLQTVNQQLEGTPFKVAYRTRNEFLLYVINNLDYNKDSQGKSLSLNYIVARALDEITSMKILSRIEGDSTKVTDSKLKALIDTIELSLNNLNFPEEEDEIKPELHLISVAKLQEMRQRLNSGYTSFWS